MCARISEKYQVDLRFTHTYSNSDDLKGSFAMNSAVIQRLCLSLLRRWGNRKKKKKKKKKTEKKKKKQETALPDTLQAKLSPDSTSIPAGEVSMYYRWRAFLHQVSWPRGSAT